MLVEATVFNLMQIGELSKAALSDEVKMQFSSIPWTQLYGMRNRIVHPNGFAKIVERTSVRSDGRRVKAWLGCDSQPRLTYYDLFVLSCGVFGSHSLVIPVPAGQGPEKFRNLELENTIKREFYERHYLSQSKQDGNTHDYTI